jgi:hypothetical protein
VCQYIIKGNCKKGAECDMTHDRKANKASADANVGGGGGNVTQAGAATPKPKAKTAAKANPSGL